MKLFVVVAVLTFLLVGATSAQAAPTQVIEDGILTGARGIHLVVGDFDRGIWDVDFVDGKCSEVYGVCDMDHFGPIVQRTWEVANAILLKTIFIDSPAGLFDSFPNLTRGCQGPTVTRCSVYTPEFSNFGVVRGPSTDNFLGVGPCTVDCTGNGVLFPLDDPDFTNDPTKVWARWSLETVPEPVSFTTLIIGVLCSVAVGASRNRLSSSCTFRR